MYSFLNDYSEGAAPDILIALTQTNMRQSAGYGLDEYSRQAAENIRAKLNSDADIHFIPGGTQTNLLCASAFLKTFEAVISAKSGHIEVHEAGAIETTGHKIIDIDTSDGKLTPGLIRPLIQTHTDEHMVKPRLVYISDSTELGTVYSLKELKALSVYCKENGLLLYLDGARLGSALCCSDVSFDDLARLCDAFYIGGTKNGALLGEALAICNESLKNDFRFHIKQRGAMLAKGRLLGLQFLELFRDDLYFKLASHANEMAAILRSAIEDTGFSFASDSPSNQIFPLLPNELIKELKNHYIFEVWKAGEEISCLRFVTSWATPREEALAFADKFRKLARLRQ